MIDRQWVVFAEAEWVCRGAESQGRKNLLLLLPPCFCTANRWSSEKWGEESLSDCGQRIEGCVFIVLRLETE